MSVLQVSSNLPEVPGIAPVAVVEVTDTLVLEPNKSAIRYYSYMQWVVGKIGSPRIVKAEGGTFSRLGRPAHSLVHDLVVTLVTNHHTDHCAGRRLGHCVLEAALHSTAGAFQV